MQFLSARWTNLILVTFEVPAALVRASIHPSLDPDLLHGRAHVSLVAFDFQRTRVLGVRVPGHVDFPEINLRTYVRHGAERGVSFIRELVPKPLIAWTARLGYNEPYRATTMRSDVREEGDLVTADHRWRWSGRDFRLTATGRGSLPPDPSAVDHHFKEHSWGYGTSHGGRLLTYRVEHPYWSTRELVDLTYDVDFGHLYGPSWSLLNHQTPISRIFAIGSEVTVSLPIS